MIKLHSLPLTATCRGFYLMPEVAAEPLEMHLLKWNPQCGWGESLKLLLEKQSFVETGWKTWGRQGRVWKHVHETLAAWTPRSAAHPEALAEITEIKFCAAEPQGVSHASWVQPPSESTPWFWFHGSFPPCWKFKATQIAVWLCTPGRQNPPLTIQNWGERGEIKIPPSEHKRITFLLHPTLPSPPSLHFLLLLF